MNQNWSPSLAFNSLRGAHHVPSSSLLVSSTFLLRPDGKISSIWSLGRVSALARNSHRETHNLLLATPLKEFWWVFPTAFQGPYWGMAPA